MDLLEGGEVVRMIGWGELLATELECTVWDAMLEGRPSQKLGVWRDDSAGRHSGGWPSDELLSQSHGWEQKLEGIKYREEGKGVAQMEAGKKVV